MNHRLRLISIEQAPDPNKKWLVTREIVGIPMFEWEYLTKVVIVEIQCSQVGKVICAFLPLTSWTSGALKCTEN